MGRGVEEMVCTKCGARLMETKRYFTERTDITMVQGKVEICGVNTSKLPLLKNAEKEELFKRIGNGDEAARKEYINGKFRKNICILFYKVTFF